jgi:hypothetical protein
MNPALDRSDPPWIDVKIAELLADVCFAHPVRKSVRGNYQAGAIPALAAVNEYRLGALVNDLQDPNNVHGVRLPS